MSYLQRDRNGLPPRVPVPRSMAGLCQALQDGNTAGYSKAIRASADLRAALTAGASQHGQFDTLSGMPLNPIHAAVYWGQEAMLRELLELGDSGVVANTLATYVDGNGVKTFETPLHTAVRGMQWALVDLLLLKGADRRADGHLSWTLWNNNQKMVNTVSGTAAAFHAYCLKHSST